MTDSGPAVRGSAITLITQVHTHREECVCGFVPTNISVCLYSVTSQSKRPWWPPQQTTPSPHSGHSQSVPRGVAGATCLAAGVTRVQGHGQEKAPHVCRTGWPQQWDGCPPSPCQGLIQDLPERKTRGSTVPIKNKLCNRWIPISCSSGTVQSYPSRAVAQGRLSHSWKSSLTDTSQQGRPVCLRGEVLLQTCSWLGAN